MNEKKTEGPESKGLLRRKLWLNGGWNMSEEILGRSGMSLAFKGRSKKSNSTSSSLLMSIQTVWVLLLFHFLSQSSKPFFHPQRGQLELMSVTILM